MHKKFSYLLATFFGTGYAPFAPGTCGSLATLPLAFALAYFYGLCGILIGVAVSFFVGAAATHEVLKSSKHDPSFVVIDEVAGQLLAFAPLADFLYGRADFAAWMTYLLGFGLFRLFDITKPQPARWADSKVLNAWGVMLDDIFAGLYAAVILYLQHRYLPF